MQPGRHLGSEEGILGSCSVVRKIMSVPCGAVSGDRSQMQPLLYGRLSFSAENSLPPSQTSSKTFSRYCGSLRLKRREKRGGGGGRKAFPLPLPLRSSRRISRGCGGGHEGALPHPGGPGLPSRSRPAATTPPSTGSLVQVSKGRRRAGPGPGPGPGPGFSPEPVPPPSVGSRCPPGGGPGGRGCPELSGEGGPPTPGKTGRGGGDVGGTRWDPPALPRQPRQEAAIGSRVRPKPPARTGLGLPGEVTVRG